MTPERVAEVLLERQPFTIAARDLGDLRPGLSLDNLAELIEQVEGEREARAARQRRYLTSLDTWADMDVLASEEMWR